ncbi:pantetheinase-like [Bufo gargarizans]|uniref:pantetheinase-like n=1 Tax=Bufo gargarizans TaxID=30331 RepID=UPI001CF14E18|nr:pantetheinase-like [Bufo gargarizans]
MILPSILICVTFSIRFTYSLDTFVAAVYEHVPFFPDPSQAPVTKEEALALMNRNIDVLETAVITAAQKGAHIIVTPEYAICCFGLSREAVFPYLEDVPDPAVNWIPCNDPHRFGQAPVQERLSCIAKNNSIYFAANFGDKKCCSASDSRCPQDGYYFYDTTVVYDPDGKLVARYHKYHLFLGESQFNVPEKPEISTFDTPFGKFGIFICYDILYYNPAVILVTEHNVDTIIFTTAWFNTLPHYSAIQFHSSWALGMRSNLLSANIHNISLDMTGSGIFSSDKLGPYYYNNTVDEGHLVLSELKSCTRNSTEWSPIQWHKYASQITKPLPSRKVFTGELLLDNYTMTELTDLQGYAAVCHHNLCCYLNYSMLEKRNDEVYVLGAYDGYHGPHQVFYIEVCTLVKCTNLENCHIATDTAYTKFESFSLAGTFESTIVYPEVLLSGVQLDPDIFQVLKDGRLVSQAKISSRALLSVNLLGRNYIKDPTHLNISILS